jgi:hypothetical protein
METLPTSIQLMDTNCKPIHAHVHAYTFPRSAERQLQQSGNCKVGQTLESLKKTIPLNGLLCFHHLQFLRKRKQHNKSCH